MMDQKTASYPICLYEFDASTLSFKLHGELEPYTYATQIREFAGPNGFSAELYLQRLPKGDVALLETAVNGQLPVKVSAFQWQSLSLSLPQYAILQVSPTVLLLLPQSNYLSAPLLASQGEVNMTEKSAFEVDSVQTESFALKFFEENTMHAFLEHYHRILKILHTKANVDEHGHLNSMEQSTVKTYFQYYGKMANQMNMLQDHVRTSFYQKAILQNKTDFCNKTVMDIGAGSGILSFFAVQAGAEKVYAVEASSMVETMKLLLSGNPYLYNHIQVLATTVENCPSENVPEKVDVLISEPIGIFLFNERMIETYLYARDRFLKPGGKMFPNKCILAIAPFSDQALYNDTINRFQFWSQTNFYGVNLSAAVKRATDEQFRQPVVDYIDPNILVAPPHLETYDFRSIDKNSLKHISFNFQFSISQPCLVHGVAGWFDVVCEGSDQIIGFSTSPWSAPTHWYQIRFLLRNPLAVNAGQMLRGHLEMHANDQQSYYVGIKMHIAGTSFRSESLDIDLKDPDYRYYTSAATYAPPQNPEYESTPVTTSS